jgi:large subunit ribosomal protein L10
MSKPVKNLITQELSKRYGGVSSACVVDLTGLNAIATRKLRGVLRSQGIEMHVVKNRMARRAFAGGPLAPLGDQLDGPCALVTGGESVVDVAKLLLKATRDFPAIGLKKAILEGDPELIPVEVVAGWKSKKETLGELAMLATSPGRRIAGCLVGGGGRIAGCLKAIVEKAEKAAGQAETAAA